jgi:glutathionyl-hydroquinone reductase
MRADNPDRQIWIESYLEEAGGLKEQNTYSVLTGKECTEKYSHIQIIRSMSVQTVNPTKMVIPLGPRPEL